MKNIGFISRKNISFTSKSFAAAWAACALGVLVAGSANAIDLRSWDQKIADPIKRFVVLASLDNAAVLDRETQLVWERAPGTVTATWGGAMHYCVSIRTTGGRQGWRLPTVAELTSLFAGQALPPGHPFQNITDERFWSVTPSPLDATRAYTASLTNGLVLASLKTDPYRVLCVRGNSGG
jgi:hypothetical protein